MSNIAFDMATDTAALELERDHLDLARPQLNIAYITLSELTPEEADHGLIKVFSAAVDATKDSLRSDTPERAGAHLQVAYEIAGKLSAEKVDDVIEGYVAIFNAATKATADELKAGHHDRVLACLDVADKVVLRLSPQNAQEVKAGYKAVSAAANTAAAHCVRKKRKEKAAERLSVATRADKQIIRLGL